MSLQALEAKAVIDGKPVTVANYLYHDITVKLPSSKSKTQRGHIAIRHENDATYCKLFHFTYGDRDSEDLAMQRAKDFIDTQANA